MDDPDDMRSAPLVTLYVMAYRQERVVAEAVEAALRQTYSPLEIVLSDDASPDRTFEVMEEAVSGYDGPHKIILNRNSENVGLVAHINRIVEISTGSLLVQNAGDDISHPNRVARLTEAWLASGKQAMTIFSPATKIDGDGQIIGRSEGARAVTQDPSPTEILEDGLIALGATCAWSREVFEAFGSLDERLLVEDLSTSFRSAVLGRIVYLPDEPLLSWRKGGLSWYHSDRPGFDALFGTALTYARWRAASYRAILKDIDRVDVDRAEELRAVCRRKITQNDFIVELAEASLLGRIARLPGALFKGIRRRDRRDLDQVIKYVFADAYMRRLDRKAKVNI